MGADHTTRTVWEARPGPNREGWAQEPCDVPTGQSEKVGNKNLPTLRELTPNL